MRLTEAEFQKQVTDMCDYLHLKWHHETDSRKSKPGWPDLAIFGPGGAVFLELKTDNGRLGIEQKKWLLAIRAAGLKAYVVRPNQMDHIKKMLVELSRA